MPEATIGKFKIGSAVELAADAYPGQMFKGEVEAFDAKLSQDARMLMVRARLPNPDRKLLPGMFANIAVLAGGAKEFVTVPRTAVTYGLYGDSVWVVKEGAPEPAPHPTPTPRASRWLRRSPPMRPRPGAYRPQPKLTVERRFVRVGPTEGDSVAILEGVNEGEQVVTSGQLKLQPGATIKVDNSGALKAAGGAAEAIEPMAFTDIFIKRPVLATVVSLLILLVGAQAGFKLPIRQYPELSNTTITVVTTYPGANADLIQGFITVPIQQAVASAEGIDTLTASSTQNVSTVTLNLKLDADPDRAMTDVLSKVAQVKGILPREANNSIVTKQTGEGYALMYLSFNSKVMNASQISDYITRVVQPRLQTINGVANAQMLGGQVFAMRIWLDPDRMASLGVTPLDVRVALAANNFTSAPGQVKGDFVQTNIDAKTSLRDAGVVRQARGDGPRRFAGQARRRGARSSSGRKAPSPPRRSTGWKSRPIKAAAIARPSPIPPVAIRGRLKNVVGNTGQSR